MKHVIGLSGGMDSATLLGYLLAQRDTEQVFCCIFYYGSKHNKYENKAAQNIVAYYQNIYSTDIVKFQSIDLSSAFGNIFSSLMLSGGEIPEGHYRADNMKATVVPGRNLIMGSIMAGIAESIRAEQISLGVHAGDHHIYPDCRGTFINSFNRTVQESSDGSVFVKAPFLNMTKTGIIHCGINLPQSVPYHLSRTCYKDQELSCGKCGSCGERLGAFKEMGLIDPIKYEDGVR